MIGVGLHSKAVAEEPTNDFVNYCYSSMNDYVAAPNWIL